MRWALYYARKTETRYSVHGRYVPYGIRPGAGGRWAYVVTQADLPTGPMPHRLDCQCARCADERHGR